MVSHINLIIKAMSNNHCLIIMKYRGNKNKSILYFSNYVQLTPFLDHQNVSLKYIFSLNYSRVSIIFFNFTQHHESSIIFFKDKKLKIKCISSVTSLSYFIAEIAQKYLVSSIFCWQLGPHQTLRCFLFFINQFPSQSHHTLLFKRTSSK